MTTPTPTGDVVERAKAALEGVTPGEWVQVGLGNIHRLPVGEYPPVAKTWKQTDGDFIAEARSVIPELVAEIEGLREGLARIERFARHQALSDRVRTGPAAAGYHSDERYWLDLLAIIERVPSVVGDSR